MSFDLIFRLYFIENACEESGTGITTTVFHLACLLKMLRFASMGKMMKSIRDLMEVCWGLQNPQDNFFNFDFFRASS